MRVRAARRATTPSTLIPDIGPRVERAILHCLEPNPAERPASALEVSASLPGGDPLAEALAAGETPSPEMVAASGPSHSLRLRLATGLLVTIAASLVGALSLTPRSQMLNQLPLEYPPEVLAEKAREIVRAAGYAERAADSTFGFRSDSGYVRYFDDALAGSSGDGRNRWANVLSRSPSPLTLWYIHSAGPPAPVTSALATVGRVEHDLPLFQPATVSVELEPNGRLRRFVTTGMDRDTPSDPSATPFDWSSLFSTAGLDFSRFTPDSRPASAAGALVWAGDYPGHDNLPVLIEARSQGGRLTHFNVLFPWTGREDTGVPGSLIEPRGRFVGILLNYGVVLATLLVAYRNWKIGRADLAGASRVALFVAIVLFLFVVVGAHDVLATLTYQLPCRWSYSAA
jgi:serine/threonine-protein kinase